MGMAFSGGGLGTKPFIVNNHLPALLKDAAGLVRYAHENGLSDDNVRELIFRGYSFPKEAKKVWDEYLATKQKITSQK